MPEQDDLNAVEELDIEDLRSEATSLGLNFNKTIGAAKLKDKIDAYYVSQETSGPAIAAAVEKNEKEVENTPKKTKPSGLDPKTVKRLERQKAANKKRIVTVIDNDQRVNSETNTCTVSCANEYFDLGTKIIPLNEKIELCQGHINVLKSVRIPLHVKGKDGLSVVRMRPRYSISYEDVS